MRRDLLDNGRGPEPVTWREIVAFVLAAALWIVAVFFMGV